MARSEWFESWKLLLVASTLFMLSAVGFGVYGLITLPTDQGHASGFAGLALLFFASVGVIVFVASLPLALYSGVAVSCASLVQSSSPVVERSYT